MFKKTMEFCNKGMVRADPPPPPVMVKDHKFTFFFFDPSLSNIFGSEHYLKKSKMAAFLEFWKSKMAAFLEFHRSTTLFSNIFGSKHYLKKSKMAAFLKNPSLVV